MNQLLIGIVYGIFGQIMSFLQLQGSIKYNWFEKYPILILLSSLPTTYLYIKSVENLVGWASGELWPSRLIGFGIGIIIFTVLSLLMFNEQIGWKTFVCLILAVCIICIQIFWK